MGAGGDVWAELQTVSRGLSVQFIKNQARLYPGGLVFGVQAQQLMHVPRKIEHHPMPDGLPRQGGSGASSQEGLIVLGGFRHNS